MNTRQSDGGLDGFPLSGFSFYAEEPVNTLVKTASQARLPSPVVSDFHVLILATITTIYCVYGFVAHCNKFIGL